MFRVPTSVAALRAAAVRAAAVRAAARVTSRASVRSCLASVFALCAVSEPTFAQSSTSATSPSTTVVSAQPPTTGAAGMTRDELIAFAKLDIAIAVARDSAQFQLALARNKTPSLQQQLRDKLATEIAALIQRAGTTDAEYQRKTYLVATNPDARKLFDALIAQQTGVPTPGQVIAAPTAVAATAAFKVPAGAVGTHIGHVVNAFGDTPNNQGLLAVAMAEAKTASQHAGFAARTPTNLDAMKMHAGHVINAIDPTVVATGPGLGYGLKKAAMGVATHIDLAAKAPSASPNVVMHAMHVATSAQNTVVRCDQLIGLAKQIQNATSANDAAALVSQLVSLTAQLTAGSDANGDGKIGWQEKEGGLQQAQEHVTLMLAGEVAKP